MAYSFESSSVKTINGEVSGLADVVARQAIANLPTLSGGEGVQIVNEDGKNRIDLGLSAGTNMSFVYDQETNTIRLDAEGGTGGLDWTSGANYSALVQTGDYQQAAGIYDVKYGKFNGNRAGLVASSTYYYYTPTVSLYTERDWNNATDITELTPGSIIVNYTDTAASSYTDIHYSNYRVNYYYSVGNQFKSTWSKFDIDGLHSSGVIRDSQSTTTSSVNFTFADMKYLQENSASLSNTYYGISPIVVNNTSNLISADTWSFSAGNGLVFTDDNVNKVTKLEVEGESLSAGPNIDIFSSGGYVVISADGGNAFPMTGTDGTANYTANANFSSFTLTTGQGAAGAHVNMNVKGVHFEAYPSTDVSASWYNIITATNNRSNCYCIRFTNAMTSADLADYSAYDKVTVVHSNEYTPDCMLYWDGNTKVFPSGLYCELVKGTNDQNQLDWFFTNSGWINSVWWDYD